MIDKELRHIYETYSKDELECANIHCNNVLTLYEIERQKKSKKYRFCNKCRNSKTRNYSTWKCITCDNLMNSTTSLFGKLYCNDRCNDSLSSKVHVKNYHSHIKKVSERLQKEVHYIK